MPLSIVDSDSSIESLDMTASNTATNASSQCVPDRQYGSRIFPELESPRRYGFRLFPKLAPGARKVKKSKPVQPFRLLSLPAELWVRIGKFAIDSSPACTNYQLFPSIHFRSSNSSDDSDSAPSNCDPHDQPAITLTCRVLRQELLPYYYATKIDVTLKFKSHRFSDYGVNQAAREYLARIGPENRRSISGLRVKMPSKLDVEDTVAWFGEGDIAVQLVDEAVEEYWVVYRVRFLEDENAILGTHAVM